MNSPPGWPATAAACGLAAAGAVVFLALPLLLGMLVDQRELSEAQSGRVASAYFATYLLSSGTAFIWSRKAAPATAALLGYVTMAAGLMLAALTMNITSLAFSLGLAGIGGGALFSIGVGIIAASERADRDFGWMLTAQQLLAAFYLLLVPGWSLAMALGLIAAVCAALAFSTRLLPRQAIITTPAESSARAAPRQAARIALATMVINFAAMSAIWAFTERIAVTNELSTGQIGSALSLSMLGGLAGALLVTRLGDRFGRRAPLALSALLFAAICTGLGLPFNWLGFLLLAAAFSFAWNFVTAYQMGTIAALDTSGSSATLIPAAQGAGAMLGPWGAGLLLARQSYDTLLLSGGVLILLSLAVFIALNPRTAAS